MSKNTLEVFDFKAFVFGIVCIDKIFLNSIYRSEETKKKKKKDENSEMKEILARMKRMEELHQKKEKEHQETVAALNKRIEDLQGVVFNRFSQG